MFYWDGPGFSALLKGNVISNSSLIYFFFLNLIFVHYINVCCVVLFADL